LVENYLRTYVESNGLAWQDFCDMGHKRPKESGAFEMTVLALKYTHKRNGVSRLHKLVSRDMWQDLWNGYMVEEVPIDHITNGVHPGTWLTSEIHNLLLKYSSVDMHEDLLKIWTWDKASKIPDDQLWQAHLYLKTKLYNTVKERITSNWSREGEDPAMLDRFLMKFSPNALTIGFARRFATYKRATLFMKNIDRIRNILANKKHPVQFIIAGKAHPADKIGADLIQDIAQMCKKDEYLGQIIFVENYDMTLARRLISGADVWLNNPRRPLEASGTSGQKAGMNGVINCSILDGWWDEGYNGTNGWAIGDRKEYINTDMQDLMDSDSLYDILENDLIPSYYQRNMAGVPEKWVRMMKQSIIATISEFNTHRMLKDYAKKMYVPTAKMYEALSADNFKLAKERAEHKSSLSARFSSIHISNVQVDGIKGDNLTMNDEAVFTLEANLGRVDKKEVTAQVVMVQDKSDPAIDFSTTDRLRDEKIRYIPLTLVEEKGSEVKYSATFKATAAGKFNYGARIVPANAEIDEVVDMNLVYWA
ncbi:MAG: alpha-glucan family phosphorylase, partial [Fibrobacteres bacterium]|nr:alpha-glucan family phosphorylase [Fibrobacterota bacterium]